VTYAVVIVNWNGAADTLACIESIAAGGNDAQVIVVDNGSTDGSLAAIGTAHGAVTLIDTGQNLGFAAGANVGLRAAQEAGFREVVFLNNDTIVESDALDRIVARLSGNSEPFACLPMLLVHTTGRIWNCGGAIYPFGLRRYHLVGEPRDAGAARGEIRCSFFTGCCLAVRTDDFARRGGFSERFFFGEEDFELALWMRERGLSALCLTSAVVRHKVSASFDAAAHGSHARKVFIYYLNRFIHMRLRVGGWRWGVWCAAYLPYVALLLWRSGTVGAGELPSFIGRLLRHARSMDRVTRADFEAVMAGKL
jgi:GT2 family glycosyltransferase